MLKPAVSMCALLLGRVDRRLLIAIAIHIPVCIAALVLEATLNNEYRIAFDPGRTNLLIFAVSFPFFGVVFLLADFSFGYLISYQFYVMIGGFLWLNYFTDLKYDHAVAALSAAASGIAFILPALFLKIDINPPRISSDILLDRFLYLVLSAAAFTVIFGSIHNLKFTTLQNADDIRSRGEILLPTAVRYAVGITSNSLLPFVFARFVGKKLYLRAAIIILLLACFYPITLSKTSFFTPAWLVFIAVLSRLFEPRLISVLFLLLPMSLGLISTVLPVSPYIFRLLDHRMYFVPANALAIYNDFFSQHVPTYFCQVNVIKIVFGCPYGELGPLFKEIYSQGNYNASLFATEGIASVGAKFAPLAVLFCSLVVVFASAASRRLPPSLVMTSSSVLPFIFLNVPFSVTMLSSGAAILFLLWYLTPSETARG